ncbi:hypothetical protein M3N64_02000 [Sporolactobacillus sp. CPB3-1]|uniref:Uncharacterized protein n=1 Tax=Sporolactobacillus mangiferae TaxID=2940498 RepID=A0ABT0M790_9BACL|nr:hypothetical protein [Sporolactobacillus mangiferae]MCL1630727.1 hypothetical protein [Sporolactobacillus mangiferae]
MRRSRKVILRSVQLLLVLALLYIPMMEHPPKMPIYKSLEQQPLIESEQISRTSDSEQQTDIPVSGKKKFLAYTPIIK